MNDRLEGIVSYLVEAREEADLTQSALAKAVGISPGYLSRIESMERRLSLPMMLRFCDALGLDPSDVIASE